MAKRRSAGIRWRIRAIGILARWPLGGNRPLNTDRPAACQHEGGCDSVSLSGKLQMPFPGLIDDGADRQMLPIRHGKDVPLAFIAHRRSSACICGFNFFLGPAKAIG
jgi:hypothetical protein